MFFRILGGMATLKQKIKAERDARQLCEDHDIEPPDSVEYGETCIRLLWHEPKVVLVVDIDEPSADLHIDELSADPSLDLDELLADPDVENEFLD